MGVVFEGRLLRACVLCAVGAGFVTVGCSGSDDAGGAGSSAPSEPAKVFAERLAKTLATVKAKKDCGPLNAISARSSTTLPCPAPKAFRESMAKFEVTAAEEHGTAALVGYKSGAVKDGATLALVVAPNGKWSISRFGLGLKPDVGTSDAKDGDAFDTALRSYLNAVRERDCKGFYAHAIAISQSRQDACAKELPDTKDLGRRLALDEDASPSYIGGNATYRFYGLDTAKPNPKSFTISVVRLATKPKPRFAVLDAAVSAHPEGSGVD